MARSFTGGSTDKITVTNPLTLGAGSAFTYWQWWYSTDSTNSRGTGKGTTVDLFAYTNVSTDTVFAEVGRGSVNGSAVSVANSMPQDVWAFAASTYDESNGPQMYRGTLTTTVVELALNGGYSNAGSGDTNANSGDVWINNRSATQVLAAGGRGQWWGLLDRRLTVNELRDVQFSPWVVRSGQRFLLNAEHVSGSTMLDLSGGGRNGTITGTAAATPVPLWRRDRRIVYQYISPAAITTIRPSADVTDSGWLNEAASNTNLYASVDDSPNDDATYIQSPLTATPNAVTIGLANPGGTPGAGALTLTIRLKRIPL